MRSLKKLTLVNRKTKKKTKKAMKMGAK